MSTPLSRSERLRAEARQAADLAPRTPRPGSEDAQRLPSRVSERLY